jgi:hypothetical protein
LLSWFLEDLFLTVFILKKGFKYLFTFNMSRFLYCFKKILESIPLSQTPFLLGAKPPGGGRGWEGRVYASWIHPQILCTPPKFKILEITLKGKLVKAGAGDTEDCEL